MQQYLDAVRDVLTTGERSSNRTGIDTLFKHGLCMEFNLGEGFPLVTTKKVPWRSCFAEMLGFWKGFNSAADFRMLGTKVWDDNANKNKTWLNNPNRKGRDDIGRAYGVQARGWISHDFDEGLYSTLDQLRTVYNDLSQGIDNRREIVTHWNPGELDMMALPPCHLLYQFGISNDGANLDMIVYVRSNDMGLGMPFNIAGYAWLLSVMARITKKTPGKLVYIAWNYHVYVNHIDQLNEQITRKPYLKPILQIHESIQTFSDVERSTVDDYFIFNYGSHPAIKMEMAI